MDRIKWQLEEVIMLVDLYKRSLTIDIEEKKLEIEKLSNLLNNRAKILNIVASEKFRNVNGITMQLENIRYIATDGQEGLSSFSKAGNDIYKLSVILPDVFEQMVNEFNDRYSSI